MLRHPDAELAGPQRDEVRLEFPEGISHLNDRNQWFSGTVVAEKDRDRVEGIAKKPGECEQADRGWFGFELLAFEIDQQVFPDRSRLKLELVLTTERIQIRLVRTEDRHRVLKLPELVEVEKKQENPVNKFVLFRKNPTVHDRAFVKAGADHDCRIGRITLARFTAEA